MLAKAIQYATEKHQLQKRKHMQVPFIDHPLRVMHYVCQDPQFGGDDMAAIIAVLHDVVEDCTGETDEEREVLYAEITELFEVMTYRPPSRLGDEITRGVHELTNEYTNARYPDLNRKQRKEKEIKRLKGITDRGKIIKLYDRLANLEDTIRCASETQKFTMKFAQESWDLAFALASHDNAYISSRVMSVAYQLKQIVQNAGA